MMAKRLGRPPQYAAPEELQARVDDYFAGINGGTPTVMGLALHCDLSYQGLMEYSQKEDFSAIVNKAKTRIALGIEADLVEGANNPAGRIFWLKCQAKWDDGYSRGGGDKQLNITGNTIVLLPGGLDDLHSRGLLGDVVDPDVLDAVYDDEPHDNAQKDLCASEE